MKDDLLNVVSASPCELFVFTRLKTGYAHEDAEEESESAYINSFGVFEEGLSDQWKRLALFLMSHLCTPANHVYILTHPEVNHGASPVNILADHDVQETDHALYVYTDTDHELPTDGSHSPDKRIASQDVHTPLDFHQKT